MLRKPHRIDMGSNLIPKSYFIWHVSLSSFSDLLINTEIDVIKNQITSAIEQMTMQGINPKTLDISKSTIFNEKNDLSSEAGLLNEYKRLSVQSKQLQIIEKRSSTQMEALRREEMSMSNDIDKFLNLEALRTNAAKRLEEISIKLEDAKHKHRVTQDVVEQANRRNEDIKEQLKSNDNYRQISHLEEKLNDFVMENKTQQETFDQLRKVCQSDFNVLTNSQMYSPFLCRNMIIWA